MVSHFGGVDIVDGVTFLGRPITTLECRHCSAQFRAAVQLFVKSTEMLDIFYFDGAYSQENMKTHTEGTAFLQTHYNGRCRCVPKTKRGSDANLKN